MDAVGYLPSPIGWIRFVINEKRQLVRIDLNVPPPLEVQNASLFKDIFEQFETYFVGELKAFELPFCLNGSTFEMRVLEVLLQIPYGETRSYGEIAAVCGNPKAARAVGQAVHRNPLPIVVPCHRVVGALNLGGYAGGLSIKRFLLRLEGSLWGRSLKKGDNNGAGRGLVKVFLGDNSGGWA